MHKLWNTSHVRNCENSKKSGSIDSNVDIVSYNAIVIKLECRFVVVYRNATLTSTNISKSMKLHIVYKRCLIFVRAFICCTARTVRRRSRRTFSTHFEIFRRRFDGVVIYFFNSDFKFFDDASKFSVTSFYVVFIFS